MKQEIQFSLFRALSTKQPPTLITLAEIYRMITADSGLKGDTEKFRYFTSQGFGKEADEIKRTRCPAFTPAAIFEQYRRYNCISGITQYSMVDLDDLTEAEVVRFMELLKDDPYWLLAYITISGKGLRIIFRVEGVTDQKTYLKAFYQGNAHYLATGGISCLFMATISMRAKRQHGVPRCSSDYGSRDQRRSLRSLIGLETLGNLEIQMMAHRCPITTRSPMPSPPPNS